MEERVPRSTGEVLSDAVGLLRRHFKSMYLLSLPFCAADVVFREAGQSAMQILRTKLDDPTKVDVDTVVQALAAAAGGIGLILASAVALQLLSAGIIAMSGRAWRGSTPVLGDAAGAIGSRGASLVLTGLLFILAFVVAMLVPAVLIGVTAAFVDPIVAVLVAILGVVFLIGAAIYLTLRWGLFSQTVVLEGRFGPGAFSRSTELMAGRGLPFFESAKFRLSILFLVSFALSSTVQSLFIAPRLVLAAFTDWKLQDGLPPLAAMPIWFIIPFGLIEVATNALIVPFSSVLMTLFYYDTRVRYEAVDIE
jgi:hypothetical protein